jgi:hypothetical protein
MAHANAYTSDSAVLQQRRRTPPPRQEAERSSSATIKYQESKSDQQICDMLISAIEQSLSATKISSDTTPRRVSTSGSMDMDTMMLYVPSAECELNGLLCPGANDKNERDDIDCEEFGFFVDMEEGVSSDAPSSLREETLGDGGANTEITWEQKEPPRFQLLRMIKSLSQTGGFCPRT